MMALEEKFDITIEGAATDGIEKVSDVTNIIEKIVRSLTHRILSRPSLSTAASVLAVTLGLTTAVLCSNPARSSSLQRRATRPRRPLKPRPRLPLRPRRRKWWVSSAAQRSWRLEPFGAAGAGEANEACSEREPPRHTVYNETPVSVLEHSSECFNR